MGFPKRRPVARGEHQHNGGVCVDYMGFKL